MRKKINPIERLFLKIDNKIKSLQHSISNERLHQAFQSLGVNCHFGERPCIVGAGCIKIGDHFQSGDDLMLQAWQEYQGVHYTPEIKIGNNVVFTMREQVSCIDYVEIGDGVLLGNDVYISDNTHGEIRADLMEIEPVKRKLFSKGPVIIGKNVWIGRCTTVLSGVTIGDNAIIGANSVVNSDIPANCVAAGIPAKVIRFIE